MSNTVFFHNAVKILDGNRYEIDLTPCSPDHYFSTSAQTLLNILHILEHADEFSLVYRQIKELKGHAAEIQNESDLYFEPDEVLQVTNLTQRIILSADSRLLFLRRNRQTETYLERLPPELATQVLRFVLTNRLATTCPAFENGARRADETYLERARELGYEGDAEVPRDYLRGLDLVMRNIPPFTRYCSYFPDGLINFERTALNVMENITGDEVCTLLPDCAAFFRRVIEKRSLFLTKTLFVNKIIDLLSIMPPEATMSRRCCLLLLVHSLQKGTLPQAADQIVNAVAKYGDRELLQKIIPFYSGCDLIWATLFGGSLEHLQFILEMFDAANEKGTTEETATPLHYLANEWIKNRDNEEFDRPRCLKMMKLILEKRGYPYLPDPSGVTAMDLLERALTVEEMRVLGFKLVRDKEHAAAIEENKRLKA